MNKSVGIFVWQRPKSYRIYHAKHCGVRTCAYSQHYEHGKAETRIRQEAAKAVTKIFYEISQEASQPKMTSDDSGIWVPPLLRACQ